MRNRRLFVFVIGLEILLQNMANNDIDSKGRIPHISKDEDKMQFKNYCKVVKLHQKRIFLERCVKENVLLRSNQKQCVDYDLLIIQQKRLISNSIKEIDTFVKYNKINWMSINKIQKIKLKNIQNQTKFEYITKFNWIWNKQFQNIINAKLTTRKKRKNKRDNDRYRKGKKQRLEENQRKRAEQMILNKSDYALTE